MTGTHRPGPAHAGDGAPSAEQAIVYGFDHLAPHYDRMIGAVERLAFGRHRGWVGARARGRVLELGVGTGLNLPHYGPAVAEVIGLDLSGEMIARARARARALGMADRTDLRVGDVQRLDLPGAHVDTVVSTLTFCTIPDPQAAAMEAARVLRPGGRMVMVEHGPSTRRWLTGAMARVDPAFQRWAHDHLLRDPVPYVRRAGLVVDRVERRGVGGVVFRVLAHRPH